MDLKKISDAVSKEVVKNTKFNKVNTKVNNLENKIPDATTLIHINHYNTDKGLEKKIEAVDKKTQRYWFSNNYCIAKIGKNEKNENKIPDIGGLVTTNALNKNIEWAENRALDHAKYITTDEFTKFAG